MTKTEYEKLNEQQKEGATVNAYDCPKGHRTITVDRHRGVTPFFISCEHNTTTHGGKVVKCGLNAQSNMYGIWQAATPTHEFYRPSYEYFLNIKNPALKDHIERGGLAFRKIGDLECYQ